MHKQGQSSPACCRGVVHFDYVSGNGVPKNVATMSNGELSSLLWQKCNLVLEAEGERQQRLAPEKQMMRLRMLAPLITVNTSQARPILTDTSA